MPAGTTTTACGKRSPPHETTVTFAAAAMSLALVAWHRAWRFSRRRPGGPAMHPEVHVRRAPRAPHGPRRCLRRRRAMVIAIAAFDSRTALGGAAAGGIRARASDGGLSRSRSRTAGMLAKVFSEMIDEAPARCRSVRHARRRRIAAADVRLRRWFRAPCPTWCAYAFYRFECALRSSAILGFFGFPTLGYYIAASFENLLYGEVWTYLFVLFGLVAMMPTGGAARLRRRFVA